MKTVNPTDLQPAEFYRYMISSWGEGFGFRVDIQRNKPVR